MSGGLYGYSEMLDNACDYGYDRYPMGGLGPAPSSSGSGSSFTQQAQQRYPQTSASSRSPSAQRRGYMADMNEECLTNQRDGLTAGQVAAKYRSQSPTRTPWNSPAKYASTLRTPGRNLPQCGEDGYYELHKALTAKRQIQFTEGSCETPTSRQTAPSTPTCARPTSAATPTCARPTSTATPTCARPTSTATPTCARPPSTATPTCNRSPAPTACALPPRPGSQPSSPKTPRSSQHQKTPKTPGPSKPCLKPFSSYDPDGAAYNQQEEDHLFGSCPNFDPDVKQFCSLNQLNEDNESFLTKIMKKLKGPTNPCPLKVDFSSKKRPQARAALAKKSSSCFTKKSADDDNLPLLDGLWNPETFMRWKCIEDWDQHKESQWRSLIQSKLDCPESHNRSIEDMMCDAFKAMNAPGGECISYRMIYGILRRNEDMYLNPYIDSFTDEQFIKLIVALNRFFLEDKDKRKMFFDHPPPTFIEKIMMKETLGVIDPTCPVQTIARRFWELLLDWYSKKINDADEEPAC